MMTIVSIQQGWKQLACFRRVSIICLLTAASVAGQQELNCFFIVGRRCPTASSSITDDSG
jgi:hypothetical protein